MYDVIVVGLGAAGAMACAILSHFDRRVLALEADGRVGGRVQTKPFGDNVVELGAEWIHGMNTVYNIAMARKCNVKQQIQKHTVFASDGTAGDAAMLMDLWEFSFSIVEDPPEIPMPLGQHITMKVKEYAFAKYPELEQNSVYMDRFLRWMNLIIGNHEACEHWDDVTTLTEYEDSVGSLYLSWHKLGYKSLFDILLLDRKPCLETKLNAEVVQIKMPSESERPVEVICKDGSVHYARAVLVTLSIGVLKEKHPTLFSPPLPSHKAAAIEDLSIGVVDKVIFLFEEIWWPTEASCIAFLWRTEDLATIPEEDMWTTMIFGACLMMANDKCLAFWTSGDEAKLVETLPDHEVKTKIMAVLRRFMGQQYVIPEPVDMIRSAWHTNPLTCGSYSFDSISSPDNAIARRDLGEPIYDKQGTSRILFAGEATDRFHFSTVHGALDSGRREARRYLQTQLTTSFDEMTCITAALD